MPDYFKLLKQNQAPTIKDNPEDETLSQLNKFSQANKSNLGPNTSLNVPETVTNAYNTSQDLRSKALDKIAEATDIGTPIVGPNEDYRKVAKQGLDVMAPNITDLVPLGKLGAVASLGIKEAGAVNKGVKTTEEIMQGIRAAQLEDLQKSSKLMGQPVLDKGVQDVGKVLNGGPSANDVMSMAKNDPKYAQQLADLITKKKSGEIAPSAYDIGKQKVYNDIRKTLGGM